MCGPVTNPTARALASWLCALGGRHVGARGGRRLPRCVASGVGRSPTPDRPSFGACGRGPLPTGCGCGVRAWGPGCPWYLLPCRRSLCVLCASRVCRTRWPWWLGTCPRALAVAGGVPLWRASWPRVGAPPLVRSGRSWCSGLLSRHRGAFPHPGGCRPRLYWVAARGTWRPAQNQAHCACRWPLPRQGLWARSASYPSGAPRWGCPWRVPPALVLGCVRCGGLACVDPVTDASGFPYRPAFDGGLGRCTGAVSCGRRHLPFRGGGHHARVPRVCVCVLCLAGSGGPAFRARFGAPHLPCGRFVLLVYLAPSGLGLPALWVFFFPSCFSPVFPPPLSRPRCLRLFVLPGPGCSGPWRSAFALSPPPFLCSFFFSLVLLWCPAFSTPLRPLAPPPLFVSFCSLPPPSCFSVFTSCFLFVWFVPPPAPFPRYFVLLLSVPLALALCCAAPPVFFLPPPLFLLFFPLLFFLFFCPLSGPLLSLLFRCFRPWVPWASAICLRPPLPPSLSLSLSVSLSLFFFPRCFAFLLFSGSGCSWCSWPLFRLAGFLFPCAGAAVRVVSCWCGPVASFALAGAVCFCLWLLGVRCWVWLPAVVFRWRALARVVLPGRVARRPAACCCLLWRPAPLCCVLCSVAPCCRVVPCCGTVLSVLLCSVVGVALCCSLAPSVVCCAVLCCVVFYAPVVAPRAVLRRRLGAVWCLVSLLVFAGRSGCLVLLSGGACRPWCPCPASGRPPCCLACWCGDLRCPAPCAVSGGAVLPCGAVPSGRVVCLSMLLVFVFAFVLFFSAKIPCCFSAPWITFGKPKN